MKAIKRKLLRIFFAMEVMVFVCVYLLGPNGLYALKSIEQENNHLNNELGVLQQEVDDLQQNITQWHTHSFYKEKIAREQLQMARKGDCVYYLS